MEAMDIREILDLINIIKPNYSCERVRWATDILNHLPKVFRSDRINFYFSDGFHRKVDPDKIISLGMEQRYHKLYSEYYHKFSPFCSPIPPQLENRVVGKVQNILPDYLFKTVHRIYTALSDRTPR